MRVNVYAEELTDRIEVLSKEIDGHQFHGLRFFLYLPVTKGTPQQQVQARGPFIHRDGDDDSAAITFWSNSREQLDKLMRQALLMLHQPAESTNAAR